MSEQCDIPEVFEEYLQPARFKVSYGGRGSAKTRTFITILLNNVIFYGWKLICFREYMKSIKESCYAEIVEEINRRNLHSLVTVNKTEIFANSGGRICFDFLRLNVENIKGYANFDAALIEEAENVSKDSWETLIPTVRKEYFSKEYGRVVESEIWVAYNPKNRLSDTHQRFVLNRIYPDYDENGNRYCIVKKINYTDNPWFPETLRRDMEIMKNANYELYRHVYLGEPVGASDMAIIKYAWLEAATDAHKKLGWKARGAVISTHDPSDTGGDAKGYVSRRGSVVNKVAEGLLMDVNEGADWATEQAIQDGADHFLWDGDGLGAALRRQVTDAFTGKQTTVTMFKGSESPFDEDELYQSGAWADEVVSGDNSRTIGDVFRNKRAQFYYALADRLYLTYRAVEHGEYANPDDMISFDKETIGEQMLEKLFAELTQIQRKFNGNGKLELMTKVDMKVKLGIPSPNLADSLMMSMYCPPNAIVTDYSNYNIPCGVG
ncbi:PBSX family phage terminase large subunit [Providencia sp. PROV138]|uniref:PBSX family phage terminase large subunit n=1 Tax=Providencia sp. PROV138 TaxID=2949848 RepID=UPI00234AEBF1|nr:PBSX family phage terminase large subunit [Providencia sp. PROV138]